jgi:hypothetical protein
MKRNQSFYEEAARDRLATELRKIFAEKREAQLQAGRREKELLKEIANLKTQLKANGASDSQPTQREQVRTSPLLVRDTEVTTEHESPQPQPKATQPATGGKQT